MLAHLLARDLVDANISDVREPNLEIVLIRDKSVRAEVLGALVLQKAENGFGHIQA
jgi:hypothetical protein